MTDTFKPDQLRNIEINIKIEDTTILAYAEFYETRYKQYLESNQERAFTLPLWEQVPDQAKIAWKRAVAKAIQYTLGEVIK